MRKLLACLALCLLSSPVSASFPPPACTPVAPFTDSATFRYFPQTQHAIGNGFLTFWDSHGGLAQFGYPITEETVEFGGYGNAPRTVQYFERARME